MTTRLPDPDGDTIAGDPRLIDVESSIGTDDGHGHADGRRPSRWDRLGSSFERSGDDVIGGVCVEIAAALGLDTLWVRLAFVVLTLVGGLGVFLYAGLWLTLIVGSEQRWARVVGAVIVIALVPWYISVGRPTLATGTFAVLVLLAGLTLALWNRGAESSPRPESRDGAAADDSAVTYGVAPAAETRTRRRVDRRARRREGPPTSRLGRATLGAAVMVAAAGALMDETNGGRLHPEQWLGVAAVVCGLGLLIGTVRGRGRWLIIPAGAFAAAGFVGGVLAQAGVSVDELGADSYSYIAESAGYIDFEPRSAFGSTFIDVVSDPGPETVEIDARSAFGDVQLSVADDVTVLVRSDVSDGSSRLDGRSVLGSFTVGPDGDPDVVVDARVVHGDVVVDTYDREDRFAEAVPPGEWESVEYPLGHGVTLRDDGFVFLDGGEAIISPENTPISGTFFDDGTGSIVIDSGFGEWRLDGNLLFTPANELIDLDRARLEMGAVPSGVPNAPPFTDPGAIGLPPQSTIVQPITQSDIVEGATTTVVPPTTTITPDVTQEG